MGSSVNGITVFLGASFHGSSVNGITVFLGASFHGSSVNGIKVFLGASFLGSLVNGITVFLGVSFHGCSVGRDLNLWLEYRSDGLVIGPIASAATSPSFSIQTFFSEAKILGSEL
jgi:hypothetical protein